MADTTETTAKLARQLRRTERLAALLGVAMLALAACLVSHPPGRHITSHVWRVGEFGELRAKRFVLAGPSRANAGAWSTSPGGGSVFWLLDQHGKSRVALWADQVAGQGKCSTTGLLMYDQLERKTVDLTTDTSPTRSGVAASLAFDSPGAGKACLYADDVGAMLALLPPGDPRGGGVTLSHSRPRSGRLDLSSPGPEHGALAMSLHPLTNRPNLTQKLGKQQQSDELPTAWPSSKEPDHER